MQSADSIKTTVAILFGGLCISLPFVGAKRVGVEILVSTSEPGDWAEAKRIPLHLLLSLGASKLK